MLTAIRPARMTKGFPNGPVKGMVTKVKLRVPGRAFLPLMPIATIDIPEDLLAMDEVEAEVQDANDDES